jgi:hypothetical protein
MFFRSRCSGGIVLVTRQGDTRVPTEIYTVPPGRQGRQEVGLASSLPVRRL